MTPQEINKKIAEWLGHECAEIHIVKEGFVLGLIPSYYNSNSAFDLLDVLVERGYDPTLEHDLGGWDLCIYKPNKNGWDLITHCIPNNKSKSAAICEAVIALIEEESVIPNSSEA